MKRRSYHNKDSRYEVTILRTHLETVVTIQHASLKKLLLSLGEVPHDIADMFEDAANRYLDLALLIRVTNPIQNTYNSKKLSDVEK
jgi:hypothetical protein